MRCRAYSGVIVQRGILVPMPCEVCGDTKVERHHEDYDKPMHIRWLCKIHHKQADKGLLVLPPREVRFVSDAAFFYQPRTKSVPNDILNESNAYSNPKGTIYMTPAQVRCSPQGLAGRRTRTTS